MTINQTTTSTTNGTITTASGASAAYFNASIGEDGAMNFNITTSPGYFTDNSTALSDIQSAIKSLNKQAVAINSSYAAQQSSAADASTASAAS